jgi:hypothetical protein
MERRFELRYWFIRVCQVKWCREFGKFVLTAKIREKEYGTQIAGGWNVNLDQTDMVLLSNSQQTGSSRRQFVNPTLLESRSINAKLYMNNVPKTVDYSVKLLRLQLKLNQVCTLHAGLSLPPRDYTRCSMESDPHIVLLVFP